MRWAGAFSCRWQRLRQWGSPRISPHRARARLSLAKICWPRSPVRRATEMGTQATGWTTLLSRPVRDRPSCAGSTPALPSRISTFGGLALDRSLQASAHPARTEPLRGGRARWGPRAPRAVAESDDVLTRSENDVLEAALGSMDGSRNGRRYNVVITGSTKVCIRPGTPVEPVSGPPSLRVLEEPMRHARSRSLSGLARLLRIAGCGARAGREIPRLRGQRGHLLALGGDRDQGG